MDDPAIKPGTRDPLERHAREPSGRLTAGGGDPAGGPRGSATAADAAPGASPPIVVGGPTRQAWREIALARIAGLKAINEALAGTPRDSAATPGLDVARLHDSVKAHLDAAGDAATQKARPLRAITGSDVERTLANLDRAAEQLLRVAPTWYIREELPALEALTRDRLPASDPRRKYVEALRKDNGSMPPLNHGLAEAFSAATAKIRAGELRVRSFRNVLYLAAIVLTLVAVGLAAYAAARPAALSLCFVPAGKVVCPGGERVLPANVAQAQAGEPSAGLVGQDLDPYIAATAASGDVVLVMLLGLAGAALAAALALRRTQGTSTPFSLPIALAILRLPVGALTALLGLLLMRAEFVPGLTALDTPGQILGWAIVFGYAQEIFTRLVDSRAHHVLNASGVPPAAGGEEERGRKRSP